MERVDNSGPTSRGLASGHELSTDPTNRRVYAFLSYFGSNWVFR